MTESARILVAEDHAILRDGLRSLFASQGGEFEVVGEADNGQDALRQVSLLKPDLVLLDIKMPHSNGTDVLSDIKRRSPQTKVIMFTQYQSEEYVRSAMEAGANGYFVKSEGLTALLNAMRNVLEGGLYLSAHIAPFIVEGYLASASKNPQKPPWETLSKQERAIIKLIAEGHKNQAIADYLSLSRRTVEKYRSQLMKKLNLSSTSALISYAKEHDLV